jgi:hypothetical protein
MHKYNGVHKGDIVLGIVFVSVISGLIYQGWYTLGKDNKTHTIATHKESVCLF